MPKKRDNIGGVGPDHLGDLGDGGTGEDRGALELDLSREPEAAVPELQASFQDEFPVDMGFEMNDDGAWAPLGALLDGSDDDAPPLLPSGIGEPSAQSRVALDSPHPDPKVLAALERLAGTSVEPQQARAHLTSAFRGENYDSKALPDARQIALGLGRYLVSRGHDAEALAEVIVAQVLR